ncbi:hypothetical protein HK101_003903 [Irineochytrium annulatum]|nr:hypothetical protein HK101_003903 [Irineochytrium annulatum]
MVPPHPLPLLGLKSAATRSPSATEKKEATSPSRWLGLFQPWSLSIGGPVTRPLATSAEPHPASSSTEGAHLPPLSPPPSLLETLPHPLPMPEPTKFHDDDMRDPLPYGHLTAATIEARYGTRPALLSDKIFTLPPSPLPTSVSSHSPRVTGRRDTLPAAGQRGSLVKVTGCDVLMPGGVVLKDEPLFVRDGKVVDGSEAFFGKDTEDNRIINLGDEESETATRRLIVPGFIDVQINGSFGVDFANVHDVVERDGVNRVARGLAKMGVTAFCPTVVSSDKEVYRQPRSVADGAEILGAHVEGPFICPDKNGAHDESVLRTAPRGYADVEECYGLSESTVVRVMTLAPEVEGLMEVIPELRRRGVVVSLGHTNASVGTCEEAVKMGATMVTHLFNAMQPFHHRDPGPVGLVGSSPETGPRPYFGIIADGIHVHPSSVRIAWASNQKGCVLVTDAISAAAVDVSFEDETAARKSGESFTLGRQKIMRTKDGGVVLEGTECLAGSIATMPLCIRNLMKFTGCTLAQAIDAATVAPASAVGAFGRKGCLRPGADADFVVLDLVDGEDGVEDFRIVKVFVGGEEVV